MIFSHFKEMGFSGGSDGKESACNARDSDLTLRSGRFPGEWNGYPLQYCVLEKTLRVPRTTTEPSGKPQYADDTTLKAGTEEELKSLLMNVKEESANWLKTQYSKN